MVDGSDWLDNNVQKVLPARCDVPTGRIAPRDRGDVFGFDVSARSDLSAVVQRAKAEATKHSILLFRGANSGLLRSQ
jgi:hypothetical protein